MKLSERADLGGRSLQLEERTGAARRPWLVAWLGLPVLGIANGAIRDATYKQATGELAAHQLLHGLPVGAHGRLPVGVGGSPADPDPPGGLGHQGAGRC